MDSELSRKSSMTFNRRSFLCALAGVPLILKNAACSNVTERHARAEQQDAPGPLLTNHDPGNRAFIKEGRSLVVTLRFPFSVASITGSFPVELETTDENGTRLVEQQQLFFYPGADDKTFHTILCAPLDPVEGAHSLLVAALPFGSTVRRWSFPYVIEHGLFRQSVLTLDENFSSPPPDVRRRMQEDFRTNTEIYKRRTPRRWNAPFIRPVTGPDKDNFGVRRIVNGTKRYRHAGLDYTAPMRTPVRAINDAVVAFSGEQWTPGQTVCLDHGGGIFSKYIHLSERRVREGDAVTRGQVIALSGNSGGQKPPPHLHMDMVVNSTHVDPRDFINTAAQLLAL